MDYNVPIFNPFKQRGDSFYHPGNEPAICLMQIQFTYEDIAKLFEIIGQQRDKYAQTLLCKYVIIELLSLDRFVQRLASLIISGGLDFPAKSEEMTEVKAFYKRYKDARNHHFLTFKTLRDKIGAHRDPLPFEEIADLWDSVVVRDVFDILKTIPPFFNYAKGLNIFTWVKKEQDESGLTYAIVQPFTSPVSTPEKH